MLPFFSDSQERYLTHIGDEAVAERLLSVVTSPRGCGKTKAAERMAFRSTFLWPMFPRYWRRKYIHVKNISSYQSHFSSEMAHAMERYKERLWAYGLRVASAGAITLATSELMTTGSSNSSSFSSNATNESSPSGRSGDTSPGTSSSDAVGARPSLIRRALLAMIPSFDDSVALATFFVFFFVLVKRRRVFILDDVLRFGQPDAHKRHNVNLMLGDIKSYGLAYPVILLSSNEGIVHVFEDKNWTTYRHDELPPSTDMELLLALQKTIPSVSPAPYHGLYQRAMSIGKPPSPATIELTLRDVSSMRAQFGAHHHTSSARWWAQVYRMTGENAATLQALCRGAVALPTSALQHIALNLDLQCDDVARCYAYAYSPSVGIRPYLEGYFPPEVGAELCAILGVREYPRRLILCAALLVAQHRGFPANGDINLSTAEIVSVAYHSCYTLQAFAREVWTCIRSHDLGPHGEHVFEEDRHCRETLSPLRRFVSGILAHKP